MGRMMSPDIDLDFHTEDIALLKALAHEYHPKGMMLIEKLRISDEKENFILTVQVPRALVEWVKEMNRKYRDRIFVLALIRRVLEELDFFEAGPGSGGDPTCRSIH